MEFNRIISQLSESRGNEVNKNQNMTDNSRLLEAPREDRTPDPWFTRPVL